MFYANVKYDILSWLNIAGRIRVDNTNTTSERKLHASTIKLHAQSDKGAYNRSMEEYQQTYADIMLNVNKNFGNFNLTANAGFSYEDHLTTGMGIGGKLFTVPNLFSAYNFDPASGPGSQSHTHTRNNSVFVSTELGYKSMLYLTLTGRQEWASQLVNSDQPTYFYPSVGVSGVISEMVSLPKFISFWKMSFLRRSRRTDQLYRIDSRNCHRSHERRSHQSDICLSFPEFQSRTNQIV